MRRTRTKATRWRRSWEIWNEIPQESPREAGAVTGCWDQTVHVHAAHQSWYQVVLDRGQGPSETKDRPGTDHHTSTYRLKWGLLYPQQHHVTKTTDGTYKLNTNTFKLKARLKSTNLYIRLHGSMTAFIDFFKGTVCNSRLLSLHVSSLVFIQTGTQPQGACGGGGSSRNWWGFFPHTSSSLTCFWVKLSPGQTKRLYS